MRIFTPCLFFQCVFTNFQWVITLLCALSVALVQTLNFWSFKETAECLDDFDTSSSHTFLSKLQILACHWGTGSMLDL